MKTQRQSAAFTILETLAVVIIIGIIAAIAVPNLSKYRARAQEATCMGNMRGIIVALGSYLQDHESIWPQAPSIVDEKPWEAFWIARLEPYDISRKTWQCPSLLRAAQSDPNMAQVHYVPMAFGPEPGIAYRWATQPWLIERASQHEQGPLIGFQDGSIKSFHKVLAENGVR
jgi:type II secretory pathway pseudopilin PulG